MEQSFTFNELESPRVIKKFCELKHLSHAAKEAASILNLAFDHGAWVAGGTARTLFDAHLMYGSNDEGVLNFVALHNAQSRDIDLFFPCEQQLDDFLRVLPKSADVSPSVTGSAVNIDLHTAPQRGMYTKSTFQAIRLKKSFGDIRKVLSVFDIVPSMIAFNRDGFVYAKEGVDFDQNKILRARAIATPFTLKRIEKYFRLHDYRVMDLETSEMYVDKILEYIDMSNRGVAFTYPLTKWTFTGDNAKQSLHKTVAALSTSTLLKAALGLVGDGYNLAFKTLINRQEGRAKQGSNWIIK